MLRKMIIHAMIAALLVGAAAAVYAQVSPPHPLAQDRD